MNKIISLIFFIIPCSMVLLGCQKHTHAHHHDAPGSYRQTVNQQMHLPFHIEQKYENTVSNSNDFELNLQAPVSSPTLPSGKAKQHVKK